MKGDISSLRTVEQLHVGRWYCCWSYDLDKLKTVATINIQMQDLAIDPWDKSLFKHWQCLRILNLYQPLMMVVWFDYLCRFIENDKIN
jgi:hypothetical protein